MLGAEKCPNTGHQPIGEEAELPSGYWQKFANFCSFPLKVCISKRRVQYCDKKN
jgi:hypothetical protein